MDVQLAEKAAAARNNYKNLPKLRKDLYTPGKRPALAGLLSGVQGEEPGVRDHQQKLPGLREGLLVFRGAAALAEILPGMRQTEELFPMEKKTIEVKYEKTIYH